MDQVQNEMPARDLARDLAGVRWRKSRRSNSQGACVELGRLAGDWVAVRNSRHPDGPALLCTQAEMRALIEGVKEGDLDDLLHPR